MNDQKWKKKILKHTQVGQLRFSSTTKRIFVWPQNKLPWSLNNQGSTPTFVDAWPKTNVRFSHATYLISFQQRVTSTGGPGPKRQEEVAHKQSWLSNRPIPPNPAESLTCAHGSRWRPCEVRFPLLFLIWYSIVKNQSYVPPRTCLYTYLLLMMEVGLWDLAYIIVPLWEWTHVLVLERVYDWACCWIPCVFVSGLIYKEG